MLPVRNNRNRDASDTINDTLNDELNDTINDRLNDSVMTTYTIISSNPRNPNVMDILREIGLAEKAGSGFDKIFTDLLKKGKPLPKPEETETSVIFRIKAEVSSEKLIELSILYENQTGKALKLDQLFVLSEIVRRGKVKLSE